MTKNDREWSPKVLEAMAKLKFVKTKFNLAGGKVGVKLRANLSRLLIKNVELVQRVLDLQRACHDHLSDGNQGTATIEQLTSTCTSENARLGYMIQDVVSRYSLMGGHNFVESIPNVSKLQQQDSSNCIQGSLEEQVKYLLATAAWNQPTFVKLVTSLTEAVNIAIDMQDLGKRLGERGPKLLDEVQYPVEEVTFSCSKDDSWLKNDHRLDTYREIAVFNGQKYYKGKKKNLFLYCEGNKHWYHSRELGGGCFTQRCNFFEPKLAEPVTKVPENGWMFGHKGDWKVCGEDLKVTIETTGVRLSAQTLPGKGEEDRCKLSIGPPKRLERCVAKVQEYESKEPAKLVDLNRATITVDHPITLAAVYWGLHALVQQSGGEVTSTKNKFLKVGKGGTYSQPPNIHCTFSIPSTKSGKFHL